MRAAMPIKSTFRLPWMVTLVIYGFKVIGLAPVSLHRQMQMPVLNSVGIGVRFFSYSKMGSLYNFLLIILVPITVVYGDFLQSPKSYGITSPLSTTMYIILGIHCLIVCCVLMAYWAFRQGKAILVMNKLLSIHLLLSGSRKRLSAADKGTLISMAGHMAFNVGLWTTTLVTGGFFFGSYLRALVDYLPIFVIYCFVLEYSVILMVVVRELDSLNTELMKLESFPDYLFRTCLLNNQLSALRSLHDIRTALSDVTQDIADFFSFPVLLSISCLAPQLVYNLFFLIIPILNPVIKSSLNSAISLTAWVFLAVYSLTILSISVNEVTKKAKQTGRLVHKLLATERRQPISAELEHFSLHLIHIEDIRFTAYGFFTLGFTLLQSIFATTLTYLIIIIQFMQAAQDKT